MNRKKSDTISIKSIEQNLKQWRQFVQRIKIREMCQNLKNNYSRLMKLFPPIGIAKDNYMEAKRSLISATEGMVSLG